MSEDNPQPERASDEKIAKLAKEIERAQIRLAEYATITFLEELEGRVPTDMEILNHAFWGQFSNTPLTTYTRGGIVFHKFFIWKKTEVLGIAFPPKQPLSIQVVRMKREDWPGALAEYIRQHT